MADQDGDKTEEATPRRKQQALTEGNVPKSREFATALTLLAAVIFLKYYMPVIVDDFKKTFLEFFELSKFTINKETAYFLLIECLKLIGKITMPIMLLLMVVGIFANIVQFGFVFIPTALSPKWERLDPIKGFGNIFSKRGLVELVKSIFKIFVLGLAAYFIIKGKIPQIVQLTDAEPAASVEYLGKITYEIALKLSIIVLIMAILDFMYQKWQYSQDLKMTKQEIKEEFKQMEGDPLIKQKIKGMQREMARKRMMEDVPKADVVITNPTHYAVAIKYNHSEDKAPKVIAKGQRLIALRIKEIAGKNNIFIHEDPPLARSLFSSVEIGEEIPENLYKAVAEILAIVYRNKNKKF